MVVAECIREATVGRSVRFASCCKINKKMRRLSNPYGTQHTNDTLPEEVALSFCGYSARELPINFVLNVTHRNESGDNPSPAASFD